MKKLLTVVWKNIITVQVKKHHYRSSEKTSYRVRVKHPYRTPVKTSYRYTMGTGGGRGAGSGLGLEEMIAFQADVHECSTRLYRLSYTEGNRRMLAELRRRLS